METHREEMRKTTRFVMIVCVILLVYMVFKVETMTRQEIPASTPNISDTSQFYWEVIGGKEVRYTKVRYFDGEEELITSKDMRYDKIITEKYDKEGAILSEITKYFNFKQVVGEGFKVEEPLRGIMEASNLSST